MAQCLLGYCCAEGLGVDKNFPEARKWFTLAAEQGDQDARYRLRLLWFQERSIPRWRTLVIDVLGTIFLILHACHVPITIHWLPIVAFFGILIVTVIVFFIGMLLLEHFGLPKWDEQEAAGTNERLHSLFKRKPWRLLLVPAEDGFFLLPLLYLGINPFSAAVAATLFAAFHYPFFPWRYCIPKGLAYFFVALFILPYGIWSVVFAHFLFDSILLLPRLASDLSSHPKLRRLISALRS